MGETQHDPALPAIGDQFGGGYFAGLDVDDKRYAIIVAPKASGHFADVTLEQALERCAAVRAGGFEDWRAPINSESNLIYCNLGLNVTTAAAFKYQQPEAYHSDWYWISGKNDIGLAWVQNFHNGKIYQYNSTFLFRVRAIRKVPLTATVTTWPAPREIKSLTKDDPT